MNQFIVSLIVLIIGMGATLGLTGFLTFLERKVASWTQDRIGPNRVGPLGLLQPLADGIKLTFKEDYDPPFVDKKLFYLAAALALILAMIGWAVFPFGGHVVLDGEVLAICGAPIDIGVVYILAVGSLAVYGVVLGGYASNNKYSFLGGLRATAQMLSYEIPMGLIVLIVILMTASMNASNIVHLQIMNGWNILFQPLLAIIFFTCLLAETNRAPFDLAEAEQELVGGYHTEYSSMKFALFFMGEYMHMITACGFFTLLFLGGWHLPFVPIEADGGTVVGWLIVLLKAGIFGGKIVLLLLFMMHIRWTLPRLRFDQLMQLAWRALIPITLLMLLVTGILVYLDLAGPTAGVWNWSLLAVNIVVLLGAAVIGPLLPQGPPTNRRVGLEGSRFSPLPA